MTSLRRPATLLLASALVAGACGGGAASTSPGGSAAPTPSAPTGSQSAVPSTPSLKAGSIEVGVLYKEGTPYYSAIQRVGDAVIAKIPGSELRYTFANTEARPALQLRWQNGTPPDVDYVFNGASPSTIHYAKDGDLLDLTDQLKAAPWGSGFYADAILPAFRSFLQLDGKFYAAPESAVVLGLYYNEKLLADHGLQAPVTWDDLMTTCRTLRAAGISPIAVTGTYDPYMGIWWDNLLLREVGPEGVFSVLQKKAKLADNPGFLAAAKKMQDLVTNKCLLDGFEGTDFTAAQADFFQGKAAMIAMGSWLQSEMKGVIPADFKLGITPFPSVVGGAGQQDGILGTVLGLSVSAKTAAPDVAVQYLLQQGSKDEQTQRVKDLGTLSAFDGVPGPTGVDGMDKILAQAKSGVVTNYYYGISGDAEASKAWYTPVAKLFLGKITAEQMIAEIDDNLSKLSN